jgi:hypothetical protein
MNLVNLPSMRLESWDQDNSIERKKKLLSPIKKNQL